MLQSKPNPKRVLSFTEHLEELRVRLIIVVSVFFVTFIAGFFISHHMIEWLIQPLVTLQDTHAKGALRLRLSEDGTLRVADDVLTSPEAQKQLQAAPPERISIVIPGAKRDIVIGPPSRTNLFFLSPLEPFFLLIKGALMISALVTIPLLVYQLYLFIAPGLTRRERRGVKPILLSSMLLFPLGAIFAYFVAHLALQVLIGFSDKIPGLQPNIVASAYLGFMMKLMLVMGVVFEFPLALVLMSRIGLIDSHFLVNRRKQAILIISVLAAVFTPPDPFSMVATILPLLVLFELSIWAIRAFEKGDRAAAAENLPEKSV